MGKKSINVILEGPESYATIPVTPNKNPKNKGAFYIKNKNEQNFKSY